ncbi:hypothetical protein CASFOL_036081 [Castilleja foliolosa]|uniref:PTBP1-like RNA recognition motif 2 domain-containing protein n=1 Tax=Castilleja foliolosa TaxID=1961234 RepID=A0ABD3BVD2_9LAMI
MDRNTRARRGEPNRILLVTIHHMPYPITEEVLHQVFSPHGLVEKIVSSQKSAGFQALIQYESHQSATFAKNFLQLRYIYDGCCQLDIEFSNFDAHDITIPTAAVEYKTENRHAAYVECSNHADDVKNLSTDTAQMEDAIVDVSDADDPVPQTEQVELHYDAELIEFVDLEVRNVLTFSEILGDDFSCVYSDGLLALKALMDSPKIKSVENESVDTIYKLVGPTVIVIERLNPNVIYFLSYTLRTRWFLKRGRMLWIRDGQQGRGPKSGRRVETRSKKPKWPTWQSDYILEFMHLINCDVIYYFVY